MGIHVLENKVLKVTIDDKGAQLCSVWDKEAEFERIAEGKPQVWDRHAPILFPFVGKVIDGKYRYDGKEYEMKTQHGFARDMEFTCVEETADSITHRVTSTRETLAIYPFSFELMVTHAFDENNPRKLVVKWAVKNTGENHMYYFIGAHPGFNTIEEDPKAKESYYLEFPGKDKLTYFGVNNQSGFAAPDKTKELPLEGGFAPFRDDVYMTLIFDNQDLSTVRICKPDKTPFVTLESPDFPCYGIWAKENGRFICLEPWMGRTDDHGFTGTIEEKIGVQKLEPGCSNLIEHTMEFHR